VSESLSQRRDVLIAGDVQGVGFRYTARQIAAGHAVTGLVRNLRDGRVQIVVEGQPQEIDGFLTALHARMQRYIRTVTANELAATGEFSSFEIRF